jgi:hypothetical protein
MTSRRKRFKLWQRQRYGGPDVFLAAYATKAAALRGKEKWYGHGFKPILRIDPE